MKLRHYARLIECIALAQILRLYQERALVAQILAAQTRWAHREDDPTGCVKISRDWAFAWYLAVEEIGETIAWSAATAFLPVREYVTAVRATKGGTHAAWLAIVRADLLARLDGYDGPLPDLPVEVDEPAPTAAAPAPVTDGGAS
jgi:hypothetical protein